MKLYVSSPQNAIFFILGERINTFQKFIQEIFVKALRKSPLFGVKRKGKFIKSNIKVFKY